VGGRQTEHTEKSDAERRHVEAAEWTNGRQVVGRQKENK